MKGKQEREREGLMNSNGFSIQTMVERKKESIIKKKDLFLLKKSLDSHDELYIFIFHLN